MGFSPSFPISRDFLGISMWQHGQGLGGKYHNNVGTARTRLRWSLWLWIVHSVPPAIYQWQFGFSHLALVPWAEPAQCLCPRIHNSLYLPVCLNSLRVLCTLFPSFVGSKSCSSFYVFRKRVTMTSFLHENQKLAVLCMSPHGSLSSCNKLGHHYPPPLLCQSIDL